MNSLKEKTHNQTSGLESNNQTTDLVFGNIVIGDLVGLSAEGRPLVICPNNSPQPIQALTTVPVNKQLIGRQVALLFNNGDPASPVIMGLIQNPLLDILETHQEEPNINDEDKADTELEMGLDKDESELYADGKKVLIEAKDEIVLKCGASSITLTKSGKIIIRGKYLLNRSSGVNRILGGSVQIN